MSSSSSMCPARLFVAESRSHGIQTKVCGAQSQANGFCKSHGYCAKLLQDAKQASYPAIDINPCLSIQSGLISWHDAILTCPAPGQWFGFSAEQSRQLLKAGRKDRYTQIVQALIRHNNLQKEKVA